LQHRHHGFHALRDVDYVGLWLAVKIKDHCRLAVHKSGGMNILLAVQDFAHIGKPDRSTMAIGDDQRRILLGEEKLIVVVEHEHALAIRKRSFGGVCIRRLQRRTRLFEAEFKFAQQQRIQFGAYRRPRTARYGHLPDAGYLGNFLRQDRVCDVIHLRRCRRIRGQRQIHDVNFGGIHFAPNRIGRQVRGQFATRGIDGRLHVPRGCIHIAVEFELHRDIRAAELAERSHLGDARNAAKHALERRRNGCGHRFGTGARQVCKHGNRRVLHFRQRRDWKKGEGECAKEEQPHAQERCCYRPLDKWRGDIHGRPLTGTAY
jgi:hypothetical protein